MIFAGQYILAGSMRAENKQSYSASAFLITMSLTLAIGHTLSIMWVYLAMHLSWQNHLCPTGKWSLV